MRYGAPLHMKRSSIGVKLISLVLAVGGAIGAGTFVWALSKVHLALSRETVAAFVCTGIFCWATWTGINLWRNKPRAYTGAIILFALQIPNIAVHSFTYQFYTGLLFLV